MSTKHSVSVVGNSLGRPENLLIQELIDCGAWHDFDQLVEARDVLRNEVMESASDSGSFLASEFRVALMLVSTQLKLLKP